MELAVMRFKGKTFRCNPLSLEIKSVRATSDYKGVEGTQFVGDMGLDCRIIKGEGELEGKDCIEQYASLFSLQSEGGEGVLSLPVMEPVKAVFKSLKALAQVTPDRITYSFEFLETKSKAQPLQKIHIVKEGETLFDIAFDFGVSVDRLVKLNPYVKRPDELKEGEEILLC